MKKSPELDPLAPRPKPRLQQGRSRQALLALNRKGDYEEAIKQSLLGLKLAKDDGIRHRLHDVIGFAKYSLNQPQEAIVSFTEALKLRDNPRSFVNRAEARASIGDIPGAYEDVMSALDVDEEYLPAMRLQVRLDKLL